MTGINFEDRFITDLSFARLRGVSSDLVSRFGRCVIANVDQSDGMNRRMAEFSKYTIRLVAVSKTLNVYSSYDFRLRLLLVNGKEHSNAYFISFCATVCDLILGLSSKHSHLYVIS